MHTIKTKSTTVLCDAPPGHVTRVLRTTPLQLPEEQDASLNMLLPILKAAYQGRLSVEHANLLVRRVPKEAEIDLNSTLDLLLPCYNVVTGKKKRRRKQRSLNFTTYYCLYNNNATTDTITIDPTIASDTIIIYTTIAVDTVLIYYLCNF
ncbi:hypothetical protein MFLAVUS_006123 [Mucor flavus]|uniref:Uncharacterized protein n=1 Tax=Mucor flavus TaxID=439312 RepID=A0ABP9Z0M5_9FUNG